MRKLEPTTASKETEKQLVPRRCPACSMGVDDVTLTLCPLCFYDLEAPAPELLEGDDPVVEKAELADLRHPTAVGVPRGVPVVDIAVATLPLLMLVAILFVALVER